MSDRNSARRIDAHHHLWTYDADLYAWIGEGMEVLAHDHDVADLVPQLDAARIDGTIVVQARCDVDETRELLDIAKASSRVLGVVGWVDLCDADIDRVLEDLLRDDAPLVGVRHVLQDETDDDFMLRDDFDRGLARLREFDLTYDLLILPRHLGRAEQLVARHSEQRFVLDHIAKPPIASAEIEPWRRKIRELARHENVECKVSGMVTEADWARWQPEDLRPYLDVVFEAFGADRLMFGSDWPVCRVAGEYGEVVDIVEKYLESESESVRRRILGENAGRFYRV